MHLYKYYLKKAPPDEDIVYSVTDQYPLYGFTVEKKIAKRFEEERNMDKFISKVTTVDKEEYVNFANANRMRLMKLRKLNTNEKESKTGVASIVMTDMESQSCETDAMYIALYSEDFWISGSFYPPEVYKNKIQKALDFIDYCILYKMNRGTTVEERMDAASSYSMQRIDEYNYFIDQYIDTFL